MQLEDTSKILEVSLTYKNTQGKVIGFASVDDGKLSPVTKDANGLLQPSTTTDHGKTFDLPSAKAKLNVTANDYSKALEFSDGLDFKSRFSALSGPIKILVPTLHNKAITCTPSEDQFNSKSYKYNPSYRRLVLTLNAAYSDNAYLNLNNETPIYQANIVYTCSPNGSA